MRVRKLKNFVANTVRPSSVMEWSRDGKAASRIRNTEPPVLSIGSLMHIVSVCCSAGRFIPHDATKSWLEAQVAEAGMSRVYAGIHYMFDIAEGQALRRRAAVKALAGKIE